MYANKRTQSKVAQSCHLWKIVSKGWFCKPICSTKVLVQSFMMFSVLNNNCNIILGYSVISSPLVYKREPSESWEKKEEESHSYRTAVISSKLHC